MDNSCLVTYTETHKTLGNVIPGDGLPAWTERGRKRKKVKRMSDFQVLQAGNWWRERSSADLLLTFRGKED